MKYALPEILRMEECTALDTFLRDHADQPVQLDGQQVQKLGGLAAQAIVAHLTIRAEGAATLELCNTSDAMRDAFALLGLSAFLDQSGVPA
ncbi:MAG: hypothetical protein ACSHW1_12810 [Yoonia sp.]|uniref:hypothetical protein n=1 Tax=Yoonia sp. TaxID=2212373 RepID=UPI003EF65BDD